VIDESSQLRHYLSVAGIIEEQAWRHRRELLEHADDRALDVVDLLAASASGKRPSGHGRPADGP
jgi:hypothetical protein